MRLLIQDLRYAVRQLRLSPGFALTIVLTLALGIGANTAVFSVMNAVLLRMLPVRNPQQLFYLTHEHMPEVGSTGDSRFSSGINVYNRLRADKSAFSDVIAYVPLSFSKTAVRFADQPEEVEADEVSGNFFSALDVPMVAGNAFAPRDEDNHSSVAVISYGYWNRRFNRDPAVIGKTLYMNGVPLTILGVSAPSFYGVESGGQSTDVWIPLQTRSELPAWGMPATIDNSLYGSPNWWALMMMARLQPGVTPQQALARMNPVFANAAYEPTHKPQPKGYSMELQLVPAKGLGTSNTEYERPLHVLMGMVVLVLVIACVNIVMLLLARNSVRNREFALRLSLGAARWRLFRQLLAESAILVLAGALLGLAFAYEATRLLAYWSELEVSLAPDPSVLLFTIAISALAALLFGLAPLRSAATAPVALVLNSSGSRSTASRTSVLSSKILIVAQMAFCVVLLFASGLLVRTLFNYRNVDLGMKANQVLAVGVHPIGSLPNAEKLAFYNRLEENLRTIPGVQSVTIAAERPGSGWSDNNTLTLDGRALPWDDGKNMLRSDNVGAAFFATLGIPVLAGRDISPSDTRASQVIAVVNQTVADRYLHGASPIGHTIGRFGTPATIVGLVRDIKYRSADEDKMPMAWFSYQQFDSISNMDVEIRVNGDALALLPAIRNVVRQIDPGIPLGKPQLLSTGYEEGYLMPALVARLAVFFGALAALLVAVGLYGTLSYRVSHRTAEIGLRMALGAARGNVLWMILRDSIYMVAAGLVIGLPLAWLASRSLASQLYQLSAHDPYSLVAACVGVICISLMAAFIPARRAASIEPMRALRIE
jgi:predicted permease